MLEKNIDDHQANDFQTRPGSLWPEIWKDMSKASKRREKHKWTIEKSKLDMALAAPVAQNDQVDVVFNDVVNIIMAIRGWRCHTLGLSLGLFRS